MAFWKKKEEAPAENNLQNQAQQSQPLNPAPAAVVEPKQAPAAVHPRERLGSVRSALSKGTTIQGKLSFDTPVRIDGKLQGTIFSSSVLIVGEEGLIDADLRVQSLFILGTVKGKVKAAERIEVMQGGRLEADIETPLFAVEEGAVFNGSLVMGTLSDAEREELEQRRKSPVSDDRPEQSEVRSEEIRLH